MLKKDVLKFYGGSTVAAAEAIDVTRMTVWLWGDLVPVEPALEYHKVTGGRLHFDPSTYIEIARKRRQQASIRHTGKRKAITKQRKKA